MKIDNSMTLDPHDVFMFRAAEAEMEEVNNYMEAEHVMEARRRYLIF